MRNPTEGRPARREHQVSEIPVTALVLMVQELADQVDVLTGLIQGQDTEGVWMGPELSRLVKRQWS